MRVAQAAFPRGNLYLKLRDEMGVIFSDHDFAGLFPTRGQPAAAPWRLALVTLFQFTEGLSDRQAADAVRSRIDWKYALSLEWKYALSLELTDPGFDSSVLCEFRTRLVTGHAEQLMLDTLLDLCRERQWLKARGRQRTDSTHVLAAVSACNRLQCAIETMRHALNSLAVVAPAWLAAHSQAEWVDRYGPRALDHPTPTGQEQRRAHAELIGADGWKLLSTIYAGEALDWLRQVPAIETLRQVWVQQFCRQGATLRWRTEAEGVPPARLFLSSPYDRDAHLSQKRTTQWVGYKVHLTETCDDDTPHLITHVETTTAPIADGDMTGPVHQALQDKGLLPSVHLVDTGYLDAALLVASQREYQVDLLGPTRGDCKW
jgi:transposase